MEKPDFFMKEIIEEMRIGLWKLRTEDELWASWVTWASTSALSFNLSSSQ